MSKDGIKYHMDFPCLPEIPSRPHPNSDDNGLGTTLWEARLICLIHYHLLHVKDFRATGPELAWGNLPMLGEGSYPWS